MPADPRLLVLSPFEPVPTPDETEFEDEITDFNELSEVTGDSRLRHADREEEAS